MKEKEVRERIERFLKRTAQALVVPATVGLGASLASCEHHSMQGTRGDAATGAASPDARQPDAALGLDVPPVALPYLVILDLPDSGPDVESEAGLPSDAGPDAMPEPPLVYIFLLHNERPKK